ncbi:FecR family protein [Spirosoma endbachense]|uniref:DUF4974 domain-containing protein n=1 Tax=Spirosoma endbachense TaxID=2666025 RepID=A0A6P1W4J8_9BACT|nr:FecR domain-containing protein [Spirosoma endbachense]QHV99498.1 DUF4974 domain-containing protein [Spirosoma endbachense]
MNYSDFNEEDFAADDFFQRWVLEQDIESESFWQNWLVDHPEKRLIVKKAQWIVQNVSFTETWSPAERAAMWQTIQANLVPDVKEEAPVIPLWRRLGWVAAASIVLVLGSVGLFYSLWNEQEIKTSFGEMRQIKLADGSTVTLNANSTLKIPNDFLGKPSREVWIEGEAFFDVTQRIVKAGKVPFVVHANNLTIQVLGTAFNVINRREKIDVALEHGSVKVVDEQNTTNAVVLKPGEKVSQVAQKAPLVKQAVQIEDYTSWKENVILFKQKSLTELAEMMKDMYDIDVVIDNPALKQETFTGSFPADSAEVFFDKLEKMYPIAIHKDGKVFHLK